ncbi:hypothetical protein [Streptomyces sp. HUAS TT3]|uniref:hypothetical protein n=1 Tax=Streptomyces sp. HUAS TT3 TaxID=3447510 RepID=UPI003F65CA07
MRKFMAAAAAAGALLMIGATASTASAASADWIPDPKPWNESVAGAHGSGMMTGVWANGEGTITAKGKLTVTDPKACYTIAVGVGLPIGKPRHLEVWSKSPQKQCGPGTLEVTAAVGPVAYFDGPWVTICKDGDESRACRR